MSVLETYPQFRGVVREIMRRGLPEGEHEPDDEHDDHGSEVLSVEHCHR